MTEQIATPISNISRALARGKVIKDARELVVACGYSVSGEYGYFICWEHFDGKAYQYTDPIFFKPKESERTYREVMKQLEHVVAAYKS